MQVFEIIYLKKLTFDLLFLHFSNLSVCNPFLYIFVFRRIVALQSNVLPHYTNVKLSWKDSKFSSEYPNPQLCSETLFVEPMSWMSVSQSESGKINCPKCRSKLGSYSWTMGCQCQCGAKVSPAFYFVPSKIDYSGFLQNVQATV